MAPWTMDDWQFLEKQVVTDPKGRNWSVALMDLLGQEGDPAIPSDRLAPQDTSARYFALIYSASGAVQWERGYASREEATRAYGDLLARVTEGQLDPAQPTFREDLED